MILSAELLDQWDRCERRFAFSQRWESRAISPLGLLYSALEAAVVSESPENAAKDRTMEIARRSELLTEHNAFMVIRHTGYLAGIIAVALQRRFGVMRPVGMVGKWESALLETSGGVKHRIELVSHWDDDRLRAAAHSWRVVGELAALQTPLTLTAVVIGPSRGGKRHSAWARGYLHPQNHVLRFARRGQKGSGFSDGWEEVWREHRGEVSTEKWIEGMESDGVVDGLILSREIAFNGKDHRMIAAREEMEEIRERMKGASESAPMRRSSCDEMGRGACPFQSVCYAPVETDPSQLVHLYRSIS